MNPKLQLMLADAGLIPVPDTHKKMYAALGITGARAYPEEIRPLYEKMGERASQMLQHEAEDKDITSDEIVLARGVVELDVMRVMYSWKPA